MLQFLKFHLFIETCSFKIQETKKLALHLTKDDSYQVPKDSQTSQNGLPTGLTIKTLVSNFKKVELFPNTARTGTVNGTTF